MAPSSMRSKPARDGESQTVNTVFFVSNLHCPSCLVSIEDVLSSLSPRPMIIAHSIIHHSISVSHDPSLSIQEISRVLELSGFEIHSILQERKGGTAEAVPVSERGLDPEWEDSLQQAVERWRRGKGNQDVEMGKRQKHVEQCAECWAELQNSLDELPLKHVNSSLTSSTERKSNSSTDVLERNSHKGSSDLPSAIDEKFVVVEPSSATQTFRVALSVVGMTCASCVGSITRAVEDLPWVRSVNVSLLTNSAIVTFEGKHHVDGIVKVIEEAGFDATVERLEEMKSRSTTQTPLQSDTWKAVYAVEGMTCAACVSNITKVLQHHSWIEDININLLANSATVVFKGKHHLERMKETIEDAGYDATLDNLINLGQGHEDDTHRTVAIRIDGMYCHHCPPRILDALERDYGEKIEIERTPTVDDPILRINYIPSPPEFTIRNILASVAAVNPAFQPSTYHPPTIEDRSRELHARERRRILLRLTLAIATAIPTFIIGIVCMSLLSKDDATRQFIMSPMWAGSVSRAEWALFILATPVYFLAADAFHRKAIREVKALWRRGNPTPILKRFYRFGSMNMLMSLGTSIAYFSSIAELCIAATQSHAGSMNEDANSTYFDSVVFLTMFLLMGRFLEAYSKARTGDAVTALGKLRPTEAILLEATNPIGRRIPVDLLEVGDVVKVPHGSSPPFDGTVMDNPAKFDESSLTGESRLVSKEVGDTVFSGTVNKSGPVSVRISSVSGTSMLDQIIKVVREGQARRAPVERVADMITGHFVPFVVLVAVLTWVVWLLLGLSGILPSDYQDTTQGGWPLWSLRFAIAVFVVACPCGIGLAAPTALFVGGGLAAKHGILVKGGGEAFQEASTLDCIVFDKTGTLTQGGDPAVTDYQPVSDYDEQTSLGFTKALEASSGHPIAKATVSFCTSRSALQFEAKDAEEVPGKGLRGSFELDPSGQQSQQSFTEVIVGSEAFMADNGVDIAPDRQATLNTWKRQGKSVALVAIRTAGSPSDTKRTPWTLSGIFAISDPLRPEAISTVHALRKRGIDVWMLSGDNPTTAQAVGANVGIPADNVIAGVLPGQKAEKIQWLQRSLPKPRRRPRATVAMVGDGINDSPALTIADVGIAVGSGSDVAISSADFILVSSNLTALLTLIDLSRTVFRRVWFNFGWALVYNLVAMPVAAGVLYPVKSGGNHVRLDPVWASLAMALSSVSVVCSSLLLRSKVSFVGFRTKGVKEYVGKEP